MRTIRIRVVIDIRIGIIRGVVVRVVTLAAGGRVMAVAGLGIRMVALVLVVLTVVVGLVIRVMVMVVPVLAVLPAMDSKRLVITKRGVV